MAEKAPAIWAALGGAQPKMVGDFVRAGIGRLMARKVKRRRGLRLRYWRLRLHHTSSHGCVAFQLMRFGALSLNTPATLRLDITLLHR